MKMSCFFGYGSLVNRATHTYPNAHLAEASGWRRRWVHRPDRQAAYLTAIRSPGDRIAGLVAEVPGGDWVALDTREYGYDRLIDTDNVRHGHPSARDVAIYAVPELSWRDTTAITPILLSYLDVVIQGYLREFGREGVAGFLETTDGWEAPILDDRAAPIYPRHQRLTPEETDYVDAALARMKVRVTTT